jgi:hypothetical protein
MWILRDGEVDMKTPLTLGVIALLAACGGSGTPTTDETPTPDPDPVANSDPDPDPDPSPDPTVTPDPDPVPVPDPIPVVIPDVLYEPELGTEITFDPATGALVLGGVALTGGTAVVPDAGNRAIRRSSGGYVNSAQIVDGTNFAVSAGTSPGRFIRFDEPVDDDDRANLEGRFFSVADIDSIPSGSADFTGDYAGQIIQRGASVSFNQQVTFYVTGAVNLNVDFDDTLSDSVMAGGISDRNTFKSGTTGDPSTSYGLDDLEFANVTIGDDGVFVGTFTGGALNGEPGETRPLGYETANPTISGQIGDADGSTIVGGVRAEHYIIDTADFFGGDRLDFLETGAFLATSD